MNRVRKIIGCGETLSERYGGRGVGIAVLDTGVANHIDLFGRVVSFVDVVNGHISQYDDNGHGTHISGIIAGNGYASDGKYRGIAPKANLVCIKVLDSSGDGNTRDVLKGLEYVLNHKDRYGIKLVNISIGSIPKSNNYERTRLIKAVEEVWDEGLCVVVAAGNNGPKPMSVTTPGISRKVITVGSSDCEYANGENGKLTKSYSGRGPTPYCIVKPEIVAPGVSVTSCSADNDGYVSKSGSSMSTAVATGSLALLFEKYKFASNTDIKLRLYERCIDINKPKNQQGWGMIHLHSLL